MKRSAAEKSEFLSLHRENYNSHKSEKNLDNFLFQATKKENEKLKRDLEWAKKRNKFIENRKRRKVEEGKEEAKEIKPESTFDRIDSYEAVIKIVRNIDKQSKYSKCLNMLQQLLSNCLESFEGQSLFSLIDILIKSPFKFNDPDDRILLQDIVNIIYKHSQEANLWDKEQNDIVDIMTSNLFLQLKLFTDDPFMFYETINEFTKIFEIMEQFNSGNYILYEKYYTNNQKENLDIIIKMKGLRDILMKQQLKEQSSENEENGESVVKTEEELGEEEIEERLSQWIYQDITDWNKFLEYIRYKLFFDSLKNMTKCFKKNIWAKTSIITLLKKTYQEKFKFSEIDQKELEEMLVSIQMKETIISREDVKDGQRDEIIRNPLESLHTVVDGRAEIYSTGNMDKWTARQFGLDPNTKLQ